jgi:aspartyl-tRNA(Asn)/glutamyl-tRNA(Gln) amidotransferase subunit C
MTINSETALAMSRLARLDVGSDESALNKLAEEFDRIVTYMDILSEADTQGTEPMFSPMSATAGPRPDRVYSPSEKPPVADLILDQAPDRVGRFFSVPRIF